MRAHQAVHAARTMAPRAGVYLSDYYAWRSRPASARAIADIAPTAHIATSHAPSRCTYGERRIAGDLIDLAPHRPQTHRSPDARAGARAPS